MHIRKNLDLKAQVLMSISYARGYLCSMDGDSPEQEFINLGDMLAEIEDAVSAYLISDPNAKVTGNE